MAHEALQGFFTDEQGQDVVEYGLIFAMLAIGTMVALKSVTGSIGIVFSAVASTITSAV